MDRKITAYRFTLDEYKAMVREQNDLVHMEDWVMSLRGCYNKSSYVHLCNEDIDDYRILLSKLKGSFAEWQGADADAYYSKAWDTCLDLENAIKEYDTAMKSVEKRLRARIEELGHAIYECENEYAMTVGGNIAVQTAMAFGIEVK